MNDLATAIRKAADDILSVGAYLRQYTPNDSPICGTRYYDSWQKKIDIARGLSDTFEMIEVREAAYQQLQRFSVLLVQRAEEPIASLLGCEGMTASASVLRMLYLNAYLSSCWSLYDKLSNIIGRIVGGEGVRNNPLGRSNPKLIENFLADKQGMDILDLRELLTSGFGGKIGLSYLLRNCFVHEGGMINKSHILGGVRFGDALSLSAPVAKELNEEITSRYKLPNVVVAKEGDIVRQLEECNRSIDSAFVAMLEFMVGTFQVEVKSFLDKICKEAEANLE